MISEGKAAAIVQVLGALIMFAVGFVTGHDGKAGLKAKLANTEMLLAQEKENNLLLLQAIDLMEKREQEQAKAREKRANTTKRIEKAKNEDQAVDRYLSERIPDGLRQAYLGENPSVPVP